MKRYNHAFSISFTVDTDSSCEDVDNYPSEEELLEALLLRITQLRKSGDLIEAVDSPYDTIDNLEH